MDNRWVRVEQITLCRSLSSSSLFSNWPMQIDWCVTVGPHICTQCMYNCLMCNFTKVLGKIFRISMISLIIQCVYHIRDTFHVRQKYSINGISRKIFASSSVLTARSWRSSVFRKWHSRDGNGQASRPLSLLPKTRRRSQNHRQLLLRHQKLRESTNEGIHWL